MKLLVKRICNVWKCVKESVKKEFLVQSKERVAPPNVIWECLESRCTAQNGQGLNQQKVRRKKTNQTLQKFCEQKSLMYLNKTKTNAEEKLSFSKQTKRTLQKKMKAECPSFYMLCCFLFSRRKFRSFHFSYFPARNVFISLEYIIGISYWARKTILTEKYET